MKKQKKITMEEYNRIMDKIIKQELPIQEKFISMLNEAAKYEIKDKK